MSRTVINGKYDFEYLPTGQKLLNCLAKQKTPNACLCGGFGSSKTRTLGETAWDFSLAYPGLHAGIFRKNRVNIVDTTYKDFIDDVIPPEYIKEHNKSRLEITSINNSNFHFFGIDKFLKKGSLKFDAIFVDESLELEEDDITMLEGRLRGKVLPMPFAAYFCNAGAPGHPLHRRFVENSEKAIEDQDPDYAYFTATSFENVHNPAAYFERLKKWIGTPYYDRYVLSLWKAFEGIVYGCYDSTKHLIKPFEIPATWKRIVIVDFGYTIEHPLVLLWLAQDPITKIHYLYRQYYMSGVLLRHAIKECRAVTEEAGERIFEIIGDHDAEGRGQFEEDWMEVTPASKSVKSGIQDVTETLLQRSTDGERGLYIFDDTWFRREGFKYGVFRRDVLLEEKSLPTCTQEEFPAYIWGKNDEPIKDFDHGMDCIRYYIHTLKERVSRKHEAGVIQSTSYKRR